MPQIQFLDQSTRTRVTVDYAFDPSVDYWQKIESQCPAWVPQPLADNNSSSRRSSGRAVTWSDEDSRTRSVLINVGGKSVEWVMPFQQYVPAIDPAGNICPLTIATCRLPEDDQTGFADKIQAIKKRQGWFVATRDQEFQGLTGQEYAAFLCGLIEFRKLGHEEKMRKFAEETMSGAERAVRDQAQQLTDAVQQGAAANREVMVDVAKMVGIEVAKALAAQKGGRAAKDSD